MISGHDDSPPLSAAKARSRRAFKAAIFIFPGSAVAILAIFSLQLRIKPPNQHNPDSVVGKSGGNFQAWDRNKASQGAKVQPCLEIQKIIPFGRSLEIVGRVEPGSRLALNDEFVEVCGDGSFKHFTKLFPASSDRVRLVLKAIDLAGRTRTLKVHFDFRGGQYQAALSGENK